MADVSIYTDGACSGNPGPGGWGAVLMWKGEERRLSGGEPDTTNNRMELMAAIGALEALKRPCTVDLYSDSSYVINAFTLGWVDKWRAKGWMRTRKDPVANQDLWLRLVAAAAPHTITWIKVKGHSGNPYNEICDALAVEEAAKYKETTTHKEANKSEEASKAVEAVLHTQASSQLSLEH